MRRMAANLLFLLFAGLIMALSICGPEMLTRYRDHVGGDTCHDSGYGGGGIPLYIKRR